MRQITRESRALRKTDERVTEVKIASQKVNRKSYREQGENSTQKKGELTDQRSENRYGKRKKKGIIEREIEK